MLNKHQKMSEIKYKYENMIMNVVRDNTLLCKKMNLRTCDETCKRSHSLEQLQIVGCIYGNNCEDKKYKTCPFMHPDEISITNEQYYTKMYQFVAPYEINKTRVCSRILCDDKSCEKAHNVEQLIVVKCDCYRKYCLLYHEERDINITKEEYFKRMNNNEKLNNTSKNILCRYIEIGCRRKDCPYAHTIDELEVIKCMRRNCKCDLFHSDQNIIKSEYYKSRYIYSEQLKPFTIMCEKKNCNDKKCLYAHSFKQFVVSKCVRQNRCKKLSCPFKHPEQKQDKYFFYQKMIKSHLPN